MKIQFNKLIKTGNQLIKKYGPTAMNVVKAVEGQMAKSRQTKIEATATREVGFSAEENEEALMQEVEYVQSKDESDAYEIIPMAEEEMGTELQYEKGSFDDGLNKLSSAVSNAAESGFTDPQALAEALNALTEVASDTVKYVAEQETKQVEIQAKRDVAIAQINATSALIKDYLDKTFDERSTIFSKQFECVDQALKTNNTEMLAMSLNSINSLAASSPFKNLADIGQVHKALNRGDAEWDI